MKAILKIIKDLRSQSEYEIVLKRILESKKLKYIKDLKTQVIQEGFNAQQIKTENSFQLIYNLFKYCRNDIAALKILIIIHKLLLKSKEFRDHIDMDQILLTYRKPAKCSSALLQIFNNLIACYFDYVKSIAERADYYLECFQPPQMERNLSSQIASNLVMISLLKKLKQFLPILEFLLTKKPNNLIDTLTLAILSDAQVQYDFINQFVITNQYLILESGKDTTNNLLVYQIYVELIQATTWIKKLFLLGNLTEQKDKVILPKLFIVDTDQNREYELFIQMVRNKYEMPSPDSSPKFQNCNYYEVNIPQFQEEKKFTIILKAPQLYTGVTQSERPLEYNEFNEQNIEM